MAFPASGLTLDEGLRLARSLALDVKNVSAGLRNRSAAGPVNRLEVLAVLSALAAAVTRWQSIATLQGIGPYAQTQVGAPGLDVAAEFSSMVNAAISVRDWIAANFPRDPSSGAWLTTTYDTAGNATQLTFDSATLAGLRTMLASFEATIA